MAKKQDEDAERKNKLRTAYGQATQELRDNHRDEFNELYAAAAKEAGVEWSPRLTPEQRAERQYDALLAEYPHLADRTVDAT